MNHLLLPSAQRAIEDNSIVYRVLECDPELADTAAFCAHYNIPIEQAANTILVMSRKVEPIKYAVCVVLGTHRLDVNKAVCKLMGVKRASFADPETTKQLTGMMIGGVTVFGIPDLPVYVDSAVMEQPEVVMGGGNRSSKVLLNPQELKKLPNIHIVEGLSIPKD